MGLLQNISVLSAEPIKNTGGAAAQCIIRTSNNRAEQNINKFVGCAYIDQKGGIPYGYSPPLSITMPIKEGGMSTYAGITGAGSATVSLNMGINLVAPVTGSGEAVATLVGLSKLISGVSGSGTIAQAVVQCPLCMEPAIAYGAGAFTTVNMTALAKCYSDISGSGGIISPDMKLITQMAATLLGSGHVSCALDLVIFIAAQLQGSSTLSSTLHGIQHMYSIIPGAGTITSSALTLLFDFIAELSGQGNVSAVLTSLILLSSSILGQSSVNSDLSPLAKMSANIHGSSTIDSAHLESIAAMLSNLSGTGAITLGDIKTLVFMVSNILGSGDIDVGLFCKCFMESEITSAGEMVTPQSCAQAVWAAVAAAFNEPGTMGNKLNSASAAGDPWTAEIPGTYAEGSAGAILEKIKKLVRDNQALILAK